MNIVIVEPYFARSHAQWAEGFKKHSRHSVEIFHLSGAHWKWRMHGGAVALARRFMEANLRPDLILASDMLDLGAFLSLTRRRTAHVPAAIYFHENQLSDPWSPADTDKSENRDFHYGFINYLSALAADAVFFNSEYHRQSFLEELAKLLGRLPDHRETANVSLIHAKSRVLHLGMDLRKFDEHKPDSRKRSGPARILWNHRWEYDKNPEGFFDALFALEQNGAPFEIVVLGQDFKRKPPVFAKALERLEKRIVHFGYAKKFTDYARLLWTCDILPTTSFQDFFGISVMEAVYCGCFPLLPKRLAYPELFTPEAHPSCFYNDADDLAERLRMAVSNVENLRGHRGLRKIAASFDWGNMVRAYDGIFEATAEKGAGGA